MNAKEYLKQEIPTLIGRYEGVAPMKLETLTALLRGYHQVKSKEEAMKHEEVINALKDVWRLRDLLIYGGDVAVEHLDEARAIDDLMTRIAKALAAFGKEGGK